MEWFLYGIFALGGLMMLGFVWMLIKLKLARVRDRRRRGTDHGSSGVHYGDMGSGDGGDGGRGSQ